MINLLQPLGGSGYQFYSGIGSDIGELTIFGAVITWFVKSRCHVEKCYKHGKYPFQHYKLCKNHHPRVPGKITRLHIVQLHKEANRRG